MNKTIQTALLALSLCTGLSAFAAQNKFELTPSDFNESLAVNKQLALLMAEQVVCEYEQPQPNDLWARALSYSRIAPELALDKFDSVPRELYSNPFANDGHLKLADSVDAQSKQIGNQAYALFQGKCNEAAFMSKSKEIEALLRAKSVDKRIEKLIRMNVAPAF